MQVSSLDTNSAADRARDASRKFAATDVPERNNWLPMTRNSSRLFGSFTKRRTTADAYCFVRLRSSSDVLMAKIQPRSARNRKLKKANFQRFSFRHFSFRLSAF